MLVQTSLLMMFFLWLLLALTRFITTQLRSLPCLHLTHINLARPSSQSMLPGSTYTYTPTWTNPITNPYQAVLMFSGYHVQWGYCYLTFKTIFETFNETGGTIHITIGNATTTVTVNNIGFSVVVTSSDCSNLIDLTMSEFRPSNLSLSGVPIHRQNTTVSSGNFNLSEPYSTFQLIGAMYYFDCYIPSGQKQIVSLLGYPTALNATHVQFTVQSLAYYNNLYYQVGLVLIVLKTSQLLTKFIHQERLHNFATVLTPYSADLDPSTFDPSMCMFHIAYMQTHRFSNVNVTYLDVSFNETSIQLQQQHFNQYIFHLNCILQCEPGYQLTILSQYHCRLCTASRGYYLLENHTTPCEQALCSDYYLLCSGCYNDTGGCFECYAGWLVQGGCTLVEGCAEVLQVGNGTSNHTTQCVSCGVGMVLSGGLCICVEVGAVMLDGSCMAVPGCVTAINGTCVTCNQSEAMTLSNGLCSCGSGYSVDSSGLCTQICGDGLQGSLECDDNNTNSGDGCDSSCSQQNYYSCSVTAPSTVSQCAYYGELSIELNYMEDTGSSQYRGVIVFQVTPWVDNFAKMAVNQSTEFQVEGQIIPIDTMTADNGLVSYYYDYQFILQTNQGSFVFTFDTNYISTTPTNRTFSFTVDSRNLQLIYYSQFKQEPILYNIIFWMTILLLLVALISIFIHDFMAVEVVTTYQILFLLHFQTGHYTRPFRMFRLLTYFFFNPYFAVNQRSNLSLKGQYEVIEYSYTNYLVGVVGMVVISAVIGLVWMTVAWIAQNSEKKVMIKRVLRYIDHLWRVLVLCFTLPVILFAISQADSSSESDTSNQIWALLVQLSLFLLPSLALPAYLCLLIRSFLPKNFTNPPLNYMKFYCFYLLSDVVIFSFSLLDSVPTYYQRYCACLVSLIMLVVQLCYFPYKSRLQNVGCLLHYVLIIVFGLVLTLRDAFQSLTSLQNQILLLEVVIGLFLISFGISIARIVQIVTGLNESCRKVDKTQEKIESKNQQAEEQQKQELLEGNFFCLQSQLLREQSSHPSVLIPLTNNPSNSLALNCRQKQRRRSMIVVEIDRDLTMRQGSPF